MDDRSTDIVGSEEENDDGSVEEEEEPEEEQEKDQISNIFGEKGEVEDEKPDYDPCRPLRQKVGHDLKELYMNEVKQFLDKGKSQSYALIVTPVNRGGIPCYDLDYDYPLLLYSDCYGCSIFKEPVSNFSSNFPN